MPRRPLSWLPRDGQRSAIPAGVWWDAIRVPQSAGKRALEVLRGESGRPGPVIADPEGAKPCLYFLVPAGTAERWGTPGTRALGRNCFLVVPGGDRTQGPGPHWAVLPDPGCCLTDSDALREAITSVTPDA